MQYGAAFVVPPKTEDFAVKLPLLFKSFFSQFIFTALAAYSQLVAGYPLLICVDSLLELVIQSLLTKVI